jgi:cytidylate kinase
MPFTIAIDGPAGAGKSTVARRVAAALHLTYIDTGAMYRAVAWKALQIGLDLTDADALADLARSLPIRLSPLTPDMRQQVWAGDMEVTGEIRAPEVSRVTSVISAFPSVRRVIAQQQQRLGKSDLRGVVLEGRDIGTVVFPDAPLKIFLTASPEERARRRVKELQTKGMQVEYAQILDDQRERDARDSQRADSPLAASHDAVLLNTDALSIDEVVTQILTLARARISTL